MLLLLASTIAAIIGGAIFVLFAYADFLTGPLRRVSDFALANAVVLVMVAGSPVVAALLVGYAHMKRAMRRRAEQRLGADVEK